MNATIESMKNNNYDYSRLKTPLIYGTMIIVMLILICTVLGLIYSKTGNLPSASQLNTKQTNTAFMVISFLAAILVIVFLTIPNYKDFLIFISKLKFVFLLIGYIIALIILYQYVPSGIVNGYAFLFFPITVFVGIVLFYLAINTGVSYYDFDINYERIKYAIIYFCLLVFILLLYIVNPGGYFTSYFGPSLIITILLVIFGFLYLITLMTLPSIKQNPTGSGTGSGAGSGPGSNDGGFFKGITKMGLFSGIAFIVFLIVVVAGILAYPGGFLSGTDVISAPKTGKVSLIVILLVIIFVVWILFFGIMSFSNRGANSGETNRNLANVTSIAQQIFLLLFGLIFSGLLIAWLVNSAENLSKNSSIMSFVLNLLIVVTVLALVFKLITGGSYYKRSPFFRIVINNIFYIHCILVNIIDFIGSIFGFVGSKVFGIASPAGKYGAQAIWSSLKNTAEATKNTPFTYYVLLLLIIFLYVAYYVIVPQVQINISKQGGSLLVNNPVYTTSQITIGSYDNLNGTNDTTNLYDYQYAISFWVFIDAVSPSASSSLGKYTSLLNYGDKPNVLYNASENTLMITMLNTNESVDPQNLDANGNIIIYKMPNVLLQKWNNIIINYSGGTIDIFYNGKLVKSVNQVAPQMSKDTLTIGSDNGINGGICNVTYFNTSITASQVYYLYNSVKNKTPPVANSNSKESIVQNVAAGANVNVQPVVVTIPLTIDVTTPSTNVDSSSNPVDVSGQGDPNNVYPDYLSFKWFATANNDDYNGL